VNFLKGYMLNYCYTANHRINVPENRIAIDKSEYVYVPLRGFSAILAVFDINDSCIGWIDTRTLGHESAIEWMQATNWIDGGY